MDNKTPWGADQVWFDGLPTKPKVKRKFYFSLRSFSLCVVKETGWYRPPYSQWAVGPSSENVWLFGRNRWLKSLKLTNAR
jgi:hypothetical protein